MLLYEYEIPKERSKESFAFRVEEIWAGRAVEEYFTDDRGDADGVIADRYRSQYDVRVTLANGEIEYYRPSD